MALTKIEATFRCDGCNKPFEVTFDPAYIVKEKESVHDYALDLLRGTLWGSIQGDHELCRDCTKFIDAEIEADAPTYDQVCAALNKRAGV
jgi:hypothetical protein